MKKIIWVVLLLAGIFAFRAEGVGVSAKHAILMDALTGEVLFEKSAETVASIASTTKIMTALVVLENASLDTKIRITKRHYAEGSSMYLKEGEIVSVRELLHGLLLMSGNDAALALADATAGSTERFVEMMNRRARELGLFCTNFENPNGLDGAAHHSSAADMARLSAHALRNETFAEIVSCKSIVIAGRRMNNHNRLLWSCEGADGVKTGFTKKSGRCLVSSATRGGRQLICVTLNAGDDWNDHTSLYTYGFSKYRETVLAKSGETVGRLPVVSGLYGKVKLQASAQAAAYLTDKEIARVRKHFEAPRFVYAPVKQGMPAGEIVYTLDGCEVARTGVIYAENVAKEPPRMTLRRRLLEYLGLW